MKKIAAAVLALLLALAAFTAFALPDSAETGAAIEGTWELTDIYGMPEIRETFAARRESGVRAYIVFGAGGMTLITDGNGERDAEELEYEITDGKLSVDGSVMDIALEGDTLTLTEGGITLVLVRAEPIAESGGGDYRETNAETGYTLVIHDEAGLLNGDETAEVAGAMRGITGEANVAFITYPADGDDGSDSAVKAQIWGDAVFGGQSRFTVFIIDMKTRHLDIYASAPLAGKLTPAVLNGIAENVYLYATREQYGQCAKQTFAQIRTALKDWEFTDP